jgi:hypothetical protein
LNLFEKLLKIKMEKSFLTVPGRRFPFGPLAKAAYLLPSPRARARSSAAARPTPARPSPSPARSRVLPPRQTALAAWRSCAVELTA